ncbi:hypothetical protein [Cupriavidus sp. D39]|uniref:hypothetical protein n=1 Tax=Cupriavidus sp. D39 TaxID=2997877 RepID=UPI0022705D0D|nr:hypothetical protein [Cupriavidus sp. D39]MCY0854922.1 hypothetical protein [Cupriavidus sp. D39]
MKSKGPLHTQFSADLEGERALADLRTELAMAQARAQETAVAGAEARARLQAERDTLSRQLAEAEQALEHGETARGGLGAELEAALRRAERAEVEVHCDAPPGNYQAPVASDQNQVQVQGGAGLRRRGRGFVHRATG